ncbi:hypothetical protein [Nesterenkonia sp.]|uniref:hypothetical protein n=1 Tax=Nesterenkonia sp. TaxID=704201 RepID=UPI0026351404|nr:hypothetical protein [Nesterenkonia sp.]
MTTPATDAVYPTLPVWQDLRPYLVNGWEQWGSNVCAFKVDRNEMEIQAALLIGDSDVVAEGLPPTTGGTRLITALANRGGNSLGVNMRWMGNGQLRINSGPWTRHLSDGQYGELSFNWRGPR